MPINSYCKVSDGLERRASDLLQVADEKEASAKRLRAMAWKVKSEQLGHRQECEVCQEPLLGVI
jgi:hypothetical protein